MSEPFCVDCPDHEACATGMPCREVLKVLETHVAIPCNIGYDKCRCGVPTLIGPEHRAHVAEQLAPLLRADRQSEEERS